ncbi:hypothetical protein ACFKHW_38080 [Bradyrhizobium lupini]|uniref:hypothetical protein n=1 Tax=Rhizobium lupini TaxID=136996 RepID=UPI00366B7CD2
MKKLFVIAVMLIIPTTGTFAEQKPGKCSGVLHNVKGDVRLGGGAGEGEGICVINKTQVNWVLNVCSVGKKCTVRGMVDLCEDGSGECAEVFLVTSVRKG